MDWWSRYVPAWELSNTMETGFCIRAWERALEHAGRAPLIPNSDQGPQFTNPGFIDAVESAGVEVSMDGCGRWVDNRFIERLWRSGKYEDIYLNDYGDGLAAGRYGVRTEYFQFSPPVLWFVCRGEAGMPDGLERPSAIARQSIPRSPWSRA